MLKQADVVRMGLGIRVCFTGIIKSSSFNIFVLYNNCNELLISYQSLERVRFWKQNLPCHKKYDC